MSEPLKQNQGEQPAIAVEEAPAKPAAKRAGKPKRQPNYHVIIWNDEEHSYEYVIELLMVIFGHSPERAFQITREVDKTGKGIAHTCHLELAELKRDQILAYGADWRMPKISKGSIRATVEAAPE
jgi:ATP-dependent Clp protease adaptor protein ClpS